MPVTQDRAYQAHNHNQCIRDALAMAHTICLQRGARLTPLREKVLELVWTSHSPIGAYGVLAELTKQESRPAQPPTVYRALDFLQEQGLVHRLSSINAYIGCTHPDSHSNTYCSSFFICNNCHIAIEVESENITQALENSAQDHGFAINGAAIELTGLCCNCRIKEH